MRFLYGLFESSEKYLQLVRQSCSVVELLEADRRVSNETFGQEQERASVRWSELDISTWGWAGISNCQSTERTVHVSARSQGPFQSSTCLCSKNTPTLPSCICISPSKLDCAFPPSTLSLYPLHSPFPPISSTNTQPWIRQTGHDHLQSIDKPRTNQHYSRLTHSRNPICSAPNHSAPPPSVSLSIFPILLSPINLQTTPNQIYSTVRSILVHSHRDSNPSNNRHRLHTLTSSSLCRNPTIF